MVTPVYHLVELLFHVVQGAVTTVLGAALGGFFRRGGLFGGFGGVGVTGGVGFLVAWIVNMLVSGLEEY